MSNAKRPRTDEDADPDANDSKRILVYRNGNNTEWQVFTVPTSLDKLLEEIGAKFGLQAKRLFTKNGGEIRSIDELRNMDVLYVSSGGDFISAPAMPVPSLPPGNSEWVLLNVGGQYFATTKTTLTSSDPRSRLAGIFSQGPNAAYLTVKRDTQGAYMFDRDPVYFKPLLNYLRYKKLVLDKGVSAAGVLEEAKYFGIESLVEDLEALSKEEKRTGNNNDAQPGLGLSPGERGGNRPLTRDDVIYATARMPVADIRFQAADFTGADLSSLDLHRINFKWAKLRNCNLSHTNLSHCCFEGADLSGTKLERAQLLGAKLNNANLSGANMNHCVLGQQGDIASNSANLEGANLQDAVLDGSKMYGVNLKGALLKKASMVGCDMRGAVLTDATMVDCNLSSCNLQDVVLG
ncbi:BTB/POZ domain-containing protein KCTD9-like isoform X2 [Dermacentor variabilis]|uniref:BTB/POZ domain-containing protein KCTD9-like isoform X2 n=1 Tax=Dermacentor variabilis TaxID=34621 RepID=UPI003F5B62C9